MTLIAKITAIRDAIADLLNDIPLVETALTNFSTFLDTV